jgi:hypothetical protein
MEYLYSHDIWSSQASKIKYSRQWHRIYSVVSMRYQGDRNRDNLHINDKFIEDKMFVKIKYLF